MKVPSITVSEWQVMKVLWKEHPLAVSEIIERLDQSLSWKPNTVKTLISRLVQKYAVGFNQEGRSYLYYPLVTEDVCIRSENRSFLQRVYGGSLKPLLVRFLEDEDLKKEDIEELKRILEQKGK
jgi:BlaI family penicillinase repressor